MWLQKKVGQQIFLPLLFCCCCWIWDPRSGMDKNPESATLQWARKVYAGRKVYAATLV
jgi:hypothetical protein